MTQYEIKTPDGKVHLISALNHTNDSMGLTLYLEGSAVVAIFPRFEWMRQVAAVVVEKPVSPDPIQDGSSTAAPVASGE
ncbi:hypothetical protein BK645_09960 [Pseudomonas protegens]|uniref:hypothetical protein n=1 Tax=Pseudomonas protegens TaxID=380021 RepID=UPI0003682480|nr:hypothetical protein [Pseudomonas protegens]ROM29284.1 hypothetical protein BK645_09960 [Pseudomonas protegens]ROM36916.1 hypothetical protein BK646_18000 [Pseudomonas protegens]